MISRSIKIILIFFVSFQFRSQVWVDDMSNANLSFYEIQESFKTYWKDKPIEKGKGFKAFKRWEHYMEPRVYPSGDITLPSRNYENYKQWLATNLNPINPTSNLGNWVNIGPIGKPAGGGAGRLNFIRFDPNDLNTMYVGAPDGGLWKSTNGGVSWATNTDELAVIGVSDLAIDPSNSQIMYLATGDSDGTDTYSIGVLKSIDGGATWNQSGLVFSVTSARTISKILINPLNPQIILAFASNGIWRTTDGGINWTQPTGSFTGIKDAEFKPGDPSIIYAAGTIFKKSSDGGLNWTTISTGLTNIRRLAIAVTPANANYVYVLAAKTGDSGFLGLIRSTDSGTSFSTRMSATTSNNILGWDNGADVGGQGWYDLTVAASPTNAEEVMTGGVNMWKSTNGGTSFTLNSHWYGNYSRPYVHADIHDIVYFPGSGTTVYSANDGGIFKTTNSGVAWSDISSNLSIAQQYRFSLSTSSSTMVLAGHQDNGTNRTVNGNTWTEVNGGDGMDCFIDRTNNNLQIASVYYGDYFRTTTGSTNFIDITDPAVEGDWVSCIHQDPVSASVVYAGGRPALYKTTNIAAPTVTWTEMGIPNPAANTIEEFAIAPSNNQVIYVLKSGTGGVSKSTDGGITFTSCATPTTAVSPVWVAVSNTNADIAYVVYSGYSEGNKVFKTINGGQSWTNLSAGLPNIPVNCIVYQNNSPNGDAVYIGTDIGIYYRDNSLPSWIQFDQGLPNCSVSDLEIFYPDNKIRCATFGRGTWESTLYASIPIAPIASFTSDKTSICVGESIQFTSTSIGLPTSYFWEFQGGNPATSTLQNPIVSYNSSGNFNVSLTVFNANGGDTSVQLFYVNVPTPSTLPITEGFISTVFPPVSWTILNNDNGPTWERNATIGLAPTSGNSMIFYNYSENDIGNQDEFRSPSFTLANVSSAQITFDVAYAAYNSSYIDGLEVLISSDCGLTWTSLYLKTGLTVGLGNLPTAPATTAQFFPTSSQWRNDIINLTPFIGQTNLKIAFRNLPAFGNNLFIDNINISGTFVPPPVASFTSSATSICQQNSVQFTSTSSGSPSSFYWVFPGGTPASSTIANPVVSYPTSGSYEVSLTVTNSSGSNNSQSLNYITVNNNSTNTTPISACGSYTWANNGQTYTSSGNYTGTTTNCVTQALNLTIIPNSVNTIPISACGSYTWANNGQTYTSSGNYTGTTTNCVTQALNLTIIPNSINTIPISACGSYTWANNDQTYTSSGNYTGTTTNCVTQTLNLTITPNTINTTQLTATGSYTWANNGQTYTSSGIYAGSTSNCITQSLDLTIVPLATNATLALNVFFDGYHINNSSPAVMVPARYTNLVASGSTSPGAATDVDMVTIQLRSPSNLEVVAYSVNAILQTNGSLQCVFPASAFTGAYYIVVLHRASLPVWSANPVTLTASSSYSFSNSSSSAYGLSSQHQLSTNSYGLWLGELNDDGYIDGTDFSEWEPDLMLSEAGQYLLDGDFNGDSYVDPSDYPIFDFNSQQGVMMQRP